MISGWCFDASCVLHWCLGLFVWGLVCGVFVCSVGLWGYVSVACIWVYLVWRVWVDLMSWAMGFGVRPVGLFWCFDFVGIYSGFDSLLVFSDFACIWVSTFGLVVV